MDRQVELSMIRAAYAKRILAADLLAARAAFGIMDSSQMIGTSSCAWRLHRGH
jgi:hypothetical protein